MPSFHTKLTAMAGLLALLAAAPAGAVIIDDFSAGTAPATYGSDTNLFETGGVILGGERDVVVVPSTGSLDYGVNGGQATMTSAAGTGVGTTIMIWDGIDGGPAINTGNLNVDLTDAGLSDRFILEITDLIAGGGIGVTFRIYGATPGDQNITFVVAPGAGALEIPFAAFTTQFGAGAAPGSVTAVHINFTTLLGNSLTLDRFCTGNASGCVGGGSTAIPEPSTWLLMAGGLALLGLRRRWRP